MEISCEAKQSESDTYRGIFIIDGCKNNATPQNNNDLSINDEEKKEVSCENKIITNPQVYSCEKCPEIFTDKVDLLIHHKTIHLRIYTYSCKVCKKTFLTMENLVAHKKTKFYSCIACKTSFCSKILFTRHNKKVHKKYFNCGTCSRTFKFKMNLFNHLRTHTPKVFKNYLKLKEHSVKKTKNDSLSCKLCRKTFSTLKSLVYHRRMHTRDKLHCEICNKKFRLQKRLDLHLELVHQEMNSTCPKFSEMTISSSEKTADQRNQNKSFPSPKSLSNHRRKHLTKYQFSCNICKKNFTLEQKLKLHLELAHQQIKPTRPEEVTIDSRELVVDKYKKQSYPISCQVCGKSFSSHHALGGHTKVHSRHRFTCKICRKSFSSNKWFIAHKKHHLKKNRKDNCPEGATTRQQLSKLSVPDNNDNNKSSVSDENIASTDKSENGRTPEAGNLKSGVSSLAVEELTNANNSNAPLSTCLTNNNVQPKHTSKSGDLSFEHKEKILKFVDHQKKPEYEKRLESGLVCRPQLSQIHTDVEDQLSQLQSSPPKNACKQLSPKNTDTDFLLKSQPNPTASRHRLPEDTSAAESDMSHLSGVVPSVNSEEGNSGENCPASCGVNDMANLEGKTNNVSSYSCDICTQSFHLPEILLIHKNKAHSKLSEYICKICKKQFISNADLLSHKEKAHRRRKFFNSKTWESSFGSESYF